jgi:PTH1 family peptidyl-tRNA hydrolase
MYLVVGLGNPGASYRNTPHNAGFWVCDALAERHHLSAPAKKFKGWFRRGRIKGEDVGLLMPQTYMNRSGESVAEAVRYLPVEIDDLIVVYDEMDLVAGQLRLRPAGGHGGHNGMRSLIEHLGTKDFIRVRVGVGRPPPGRDPTSHLLSQMRPAEKRRFEETVERAASAVEAIMFEGIEAAMNRYNGPPPEIETEEGRP